MKMFYQLKKGLGFSNTCRELWELPELKLQKLGSPMSGMGVLFTIQTSIQTMENLNYSFCYDLGVSHR